MNDGLGSTSLEQLDADLRGAVVDGAGVVLGPIGNGSLRGDRPGVELLDELDHRDAGLVVAGHDRPLDGRRPTPARQQRRVDVQPEVPLEQRCRDQPPVGDEHDRLGSSSGSSRLSTTGSPSFSAVSFAGAGRSPRPRPAGASGCVRTNAISCRSGEPLEHVGAERRARGEAEPH